MFKTIVTERLVLRQPVLADADAMFTYRTDPEVARYQCWQSDSLERTRASIEAHSGVEMDTPHTWFQLAITQRASGKLIGDCGLHFLKDEPSQSEVGITLAPTHQNQGYATETLQAVLEFLFVDLEKHRVFVSVDPRNVAAIALFKHVGMRQEAHFVESLWFDGAWVDDVIFALLQREWTS